MFIWRLKKQLASCLNLFQKFFSDTTCKLFNNGVEDEIHFLLKCSVLEKMRKNILSMNYNLYPNTENLFIWLMTTKDPDMLHLLQQLLSSLSEERITRLKL